MNRIGVMGIFSFLTRSKAKGAALPVMVRLAPPAVTSAPSPHDLRQQLFDAAASGDEDQLCDLCQRHEKVIFEQGMIWARVPPEVRANPKLAQWYGSGLRSIARFCAQRLGKPELMNQVRQLDLPPETPQKKIMVPRAPSSRPANLEIPSAQAPPSKRDRPARLQDQ